MTPLPRVGLPTDHKQIGAHPFLAVGEKYVRAVVDGAGCLPLLVPTLDPVLPLRDVLAGLDGLLLTGAVAPVAVGYTIQLFAQAPGQPPPPGGGPFVTRVALRARVADLFHWYSEHRHDLVLVIDDGRRLPLIITSPDGDAIGQGMLS